MREISESAHEKLQDLADFLVEWALVEIAKDEEKESS